MAWATDLLRSRVSVPIVLAGAVLIIVLVRLTSLLPERYYFRFSTLASSDRSPFIVEPPGITYARFCNLVRKNRLAEGTFSLDLEGCARAVEEAKATPERVYGQKNEGAIYRAVYAHDEALRRALEEAARTLTLKPIAPDDIQSDLEGANSLEIAITNMTNRYQAESQKRLVALITQEPQRFVSIKLLMEALPPDDPPKPQPQRQPGVDQNGRAAFARAVTATNARLTSPIADLRLEPISKAKLDEFLRFSGSRDFLIEQLLTYYANQISARYTAELTANLKHAGIDTARDKTMLDKLVRDDATGTYAISVAIRLAPVLVFGFLVGLIFGVREIGSAALAGALAAFLLPGRSSFCGIAS